MCSSNFLSYLNAITYNIGIKTIFISSVHKVILGNLFKNMIFWKRHFYLVGSDCKVKEDKLYLLRNIIYMTYTKIPL